MSKLSRLVFSAFFGILLLVTPALASEASKASKQADALAEQVDQAATEEDRAAAQEQLTAYVRAKTAALSGQDLSKLDLAYLGKMQSTGGMHSEAVASLEKSLAHPGQTKYLSTIHLYYVRVLIAAGKNDKAFEAFKNMASLFETDKYVKYAAMSVGLALRAERKWKQSAEALDVGLKLKDAATLKPLVNSLLMAGDKAGAIKAVEYAIEVSGEAGKDPMHQVLLDITKKHGDPLPLDFDAFSPGEAPELDGKVVVMGFFNVSASSLRWTMEVLQSIWTEHPPAQGVVTLAVSTYYKKHPDSGMIEEDMSPEAEREFGVGYAEQYGFQGQLAYTKDRDGLLALGVSALPFIVIRGKDGKLLYAHVVNRREPTEVEVIREIVAKANK